jgi:3',5'-nucleoside bisphosphate phosphatase
MIDLHCHSHYSDGELSPKALIDKALLNEITLLAITDHDCTDGIEQAKVYARRHKINLIEGVELSIKWKKHDIHVLGLNINHSADAMHKGLIYQYNQRDKRAHEIASKLTKLGIDDCYSKASSIAKGKIITRPHFAKVVVSEGLAKDFQSAFKRFLSRGKAAYVPTPWMNLEQGVNVIHESGGVAIIAHPHRYGFSPTQLRNLIDEFKCNNGAGIEVVSGFTTKDQASQLAALCNQYKLFASVGSDYHGPSMSKIDLGKQMMMPKSCQPIWHQW